MNLLGTPNRTKIVPVDPNNQRVDVDAALVTSIITIVTASIPKTAPATPVPAPVAASAQLLTYTADPNAEGLFPSNQALPAIAYCNNSANPIYVWNTMTRVWQ